MTVGSEIVAAPRSTPLAERDPSKDAALARMVREDLAALMPPGTSRAYRSDVKQYEKWCAAVGMPACPATRSQLAAYVKHLITTPRERTGKPYSPRSVERAIAAIRAAHVAVDVDPPGTKDALAYLAAYRKALSEANDPAARPRRATPARPRELAAMVATLDRDTLRGARDAALLLLGYAIAGRESEIVSLDFGSVRDTDEGLYVDVFRKKINVWSEDLPIPFAADPSLCPVRAFRRLRDRMADHGRVDGPLFVRVDHTDAPVLSMGRPRKDGTVDTSGRLTPESVGVVVRRTAERAGLPGQWSGHSLRRGFVTEARERHVPFEAIAAHGGWDEKSRALLLYSSPTKTMKNSPVCL